jgi:anti-sigma-K factor RskA
MRIRRPESHTLAGAYALDALDGPDRARFERHAARCQECTREVAGLREATARLAVAAAAPPPAALKKELRAETARTRQLPPAAHGGHAAGRARPRPGARRLGVHGLRGRGLGARRVALALGGAVAVAAVTVVVTASLGPPAAPPPASQEIATVLTAPDAVKLTAQVRTGGTATIVMSHHDRMLVFAAAGLRRLPAAQHYELWLIGPGRDRAAGRLPAPSHGMTGPVVAAGLRSGDRLGLTVEPAAGAHRPTTPMILELTL